MTRFRNGILLAALLTLAGQISAPAAGTNASPDFQEVYDLIRQHATGLSTEELNRAAVQGLVTALGPRVALGTNDVAASASDKRPLAETIVFDGDIAYFRIARVSDGLAKAISDSYGQIKATNKVNGVVLDLRFASGSDYKAAADVVDLFVSKNVPLLNWGNGVVSAHEKSNAIAVPVAALVNHQTSGAAEALAAAVREAGAGLILGSRTAGNAMVMQDFPLKDGEHLRIGSAPVTLGDGTPLSADGIKPDIDVTVSEEAERAFYADAFLVVSNQPSGSSSNIEASATNQTRVRFNEAELVREHRAGENPDEMTAKRPPEPQAPVVSDPALARALDLLKGLAVVRQNQS
ncbi:MAG TPA: S41 family peptidase [Verrucomicrobiae bacterium]|nr:S41 family peptidase [Verrucomicrobiae bacterium]